MNLDHGLPVIIISDERVPPFLGSVANGSRRPYGVPISPETPRYD